MGEGNELAQYNDLINLPGILQRCINLGMNFDGNYIISKYYEQSFTIRHYIFGESLGDIFPVEYSHYMKDSKKLSTIAIEEIVLDELIFLYEYKRYVDIDFLIDSISDSLQEWGIRYTKRLDKQIYELCGRSHMTRNIHSNSSSLQQDYIYDENEDQDEIELEKIKQNTSSWLFGPSEISLEEQEINRLISNSKLNTKIKEELISAIDNSQYLYLSLLNTKESVLQLLKALEYTNIYKLPQQECHVSILFIRAICKDDKDLITKLVEFCSLCVNLFMYQSDEPIIRKKEFLSSEIYKEFLTEDKVFKELIFQNLIIEDRKWIHLLHIHVYLFCHAYLASMDILDDEIKGLWGDNLHQIQYNKFKKDDAKSTFPYFEYRSHYFRDFNWEGTMYRMLNELTPSTLNQDYTVPMLKKFLDSLGKGNYDEKILNYLKVIQMQIAYYNQDKIYYTSTCSNELSLIEHLDLAETPYFEEENLSIELVEKLSLNEAVCKREYEHWEINLYNLENSDLLKELDFYDSILNFILQVESTYLSLTR